MNFGTIQKHRGFTLIELMVVVVIIAIIASLALPNYREYVQRSRAAEARAVMMEVASFAERFFTETTPNNYPLQATLVARAPSITVSPRGAVGSDVRYNIAIDNTPNAAGPAYLITATAVSPDALQRCPIMTLNSANVRTPPPATHPTCWPT